MANEAKNKGALAAGIIAGSAVGIVTGMLIAPKSGKELREDIADKTKEGIDTAKDKIGDAKDTAIDKAKSAANKTSDKLDDKRKAAYDAIDRLSESLKD